MAKNHSDWKIVYDRFEPSEEPLREALCTLGNGYFGTRGAVTESGVTNIHYPGTYIAGVYNKLGTKVSGRMIYNEDFVNCPNWLLVTFRMGRGEWLMPSTSRILLYKQELDMRNGVLIRKMRYEDCMGHIARVETQRIVHMKYPHMAVIKYVITPENFGGSLVVRSALDGTIENKGVARYRKLNSMHLTKDSLGAFGKNGLYLSVKTTESNIKIGTAALTNIYRNGKKLKSLSKIWTKNEKGICQEFGINAKRGETYEIHKIVSIHTSRDRCKGDSLLLAINDVKKPTSFKTLYEAHRKTWHSLWDKVDIKIEGDSFSQRVLRLHIFHILQTASPNNKDIDAGLPARGLHGEAYRGHIFWDELFVMPFFTFHYPEIVKSLLLYRYRRLDEARKYANEYGYKGAMFPWQSGSRGVEETQIVHLNPLSGKWDPDYSSIQRHVSFAIFYNMWQYWKYTHDKDFFVKYSAEVMLSIAQFAESLLKYDKKDGRYHTEGIMGPDEFHEKLPKSRKGGLRDNTYSNLLITWCFIKAQDIVSLLPDKDKKRIFEKINLTPQDLKRWDDISRKINIIFNKDKIMAQFDGYFNLKELNWKEYRKKYNNIQRLDRILKAEGKSPDNYKVSKQADSLMIFYLFHLQQVKNLFKRLGHSFDKETLEKNFNYYLKRTSHGSTLSKVVHGYIAHLLGARKDAWDWFHEVLISDVQDIQGGTTLEGIHTGVMGGSIDIAMRAFAGINILHNRIKIKPRLPAKWKSMKLDFSYRKRRIFLFVTKDRVEIMISGRKGEYCDITFEISGDMHKFCYGEKYVIYTRKQVSHEKQNIS